MLTTTVILRYRVIVVNLHLDSTLRSKFWYDNRVGNLAIHVHIGFALEAIIVGMKVSSRDDESQMERLKELQVNIFKRINHS